MSSWAATSAAGLAGLSGLSGLSGPSPRVGRSPSSLAWSRLVSPGLAWSPTGASSCPARNSAPSCRKPPGVTRGRRLLLSALGTEAGLLVDLAQSLEGPPLFPAPGTACEPDRGHAAPPYSVSHPGGRAKTGSASRGAAARAPWPPPTCHRGTRRTGRKRCMQSGCPRKHTGLRSNQAAPRPA